MTATAHALVAGAIATQIHDPVLLPILCIVQHFAMDSIPHWDIGTNWRNRPKAITGLISITETIFGICISYLIFRNSVPSNILLSAIFFSILPDWLETPWYIFFAKNHKTAPSQNAGVWEKLTFKIYQIENLFHSKAQFPFGLYTQIITVVFFLLLMK